MKVRQTRFNRNFLLFVVAVPRLAVRGRQIEKQSATLVGFVLPQCGIYY